MTPDRLRQPISRTNLLCVIVNGLDCRHEAVVAALKVSAAACGGVGGETPGAEHLRLTSSGCTPPSYVADPLDPA